MESIVLRYDKGESIGSINSVDTGMATAIIDSDDVLSQLQINQLIAIQSPKSWSLHYSNDSKNLSQGY